MANIDWDDIESKYGKTHYATEGKYTVKCVDVEVKQVGSKGSVIEKFIFEESDGLKYPTADHWISKNNDNFRAHHQKALMVLLGASEANARLAVEKAEAKDFDYAVKAYEAAFKALLKKEPEVEIEVFPDGDYSSAEFTDRSVAMPHDNAKKSSSSDNEEEIDLSEIPF